MAQHVADVRHVVLGPLQWVLDVQAGGGRSPVVLVHRGDQDRVQVANIAVVVVRDYFSRAGLCYTPLGGKQVVLYIVLLVVTHLI